MRANGTTGGGSGAGSSQYSKVPGSSTRNTASQIVGGSNANRAAANNARPPAFGAANAARNGPNVRAGKAMNTKSSGMDGARNGSVDDDGDSRMGIGGAAAQENPMEYSGTPEMLIQELKKAKLEIETMKNQINMKEKSVANSRLEVSKLRQENIELKK